MPGGRSCLGINFCRLERTVVPCTGSFCPLLQDRLASASGDIFVFAFDHFHCCHHLAFSPFLQTSSSPPYQSLIPHLLSCDLIYTRFIHHHDFGFCRGRGGLPPRAGGPLLQHALRNQQLDYYCSREYRTCAGDCRGFATAHPQGRQISHANNSSRFMRYFSFSW